MTDRIEKPWGWSTELDSSPDHLLTRIEVQRGGYCSRHYHAHQHNTFVVVSGVLRVCLQLSRPSGTPAEWRIGAGLLYRSVTIPPGTIHWFEAETDVVALELYTPDGPDGPPPAALDIVRTSEGGIRTDEQGRAA